MIEKSIRQKGEDSDGEKFLQYFWSGNNKNFIIENLFRIKKVLQPQKKAWAQRELQREKCQQVGWHAAYFMDIFFIRSSESVLRHSVAFFMNV